MLFRRWGWAVYAALVLASQAYIWAGYSVSRAKRSGESRVEISAMADAGPVGGDRRTRIHYIRWAPDAPAAPISTESAALRAPPVAEHDGRAPVILLHGSPGAASNFSRLAPILARSGRDVIAIDLPGYGGSDPWAPSYSIEASARVALAVMDAMGVRRAHVVGFSLGGGAALWMAKLAPERVASITMLSSIGAQEAEGSGSYGFEHVKYALGFFALVALPEITPHFGILGALPPRYAFIRSFWDTDQRPLTDIMRSLETPTLILHGRHDPLVPAWGAELHHRLIGPSRLVMLDGSHFFIFFHAARAAAHMLPFLVRHDAPNVAAVRDSADFAPTPDDNVADVGPFHIRRGAHWWIVILLIILATFISEDATVITVGVLIAQGSIDWGVGLIGCFVGIVLGDGGLWAIGRFIGRPALRWPLIRRGLPEKSLDRWGRWFDRHSVAAVFLTRAIPGTRLPTYLAAGMLAKRTRLFLLWAAIAALLWTPLLLLLSMLVGARLLTALEEVFGGPLSILAAILLLFALVRALSYSTTWVGRRRLVVDLLRLARPEFWPMPLFYLPLIPCLLWHAVRRGPMTFTCANPGIAHGGGVVGESKMAILDGLERARDWIVPTVLIDAGASPEERAAEALERVEREVELGGFPVILKPDASQRGHGLRLARTPDDILDYFQVMTRPALLQRFHPGPHEAGVLWARRVDVDGDIARAPGFVFSITRKVFPEIVGDGQRTLERLVWTHPRFRMQADVFLKRHADKTDAVLPKGQRLRLAQAGNHAQGTMFLDGEDLLTDALSQRFETIAQSFIHAGRRGGSKQPPPDGDSGFDFGRFDIRYESDEALRQGEKFSIVELNGAMSESTNIYDPNRSVLWMYSTLFRQWSLLYRIGAQRRRSGVRPMGVRELIRAIHTHYHGRPGSKIAD